MPMPYTHRSVGCVGRCRPACLCAFLSGARLQDAPHPPPPGDRLAWRILAPAYRALASSRTPAQNHPTAGTATKGPKAGCRHLFTGDGNLYEPGKRPLASTLGKQVSSLRTSKRRRALHFIRAVASICEATKSSAECRRTYQPIRHSFGDYRRTVKLRLDCAKSIRSLASPIVIALGLCGTRSFAR